MQTLLLHGAGAGVHNLCS